MKYLNSSESMHDSSEKSSLSLRAKVQFNFQHFTKFSLEVMSQRLDKIIEIAQQACSLKLMT